MDGRRRRRVGLRILRIVASPHGWLMVMCGWWFLALGGQAVFGTPRGYDPLTLAMFNVFAGVFGGLTWLVSTLLFDGWLKVHRWRSRRNPPTGRQSAFIGRQGHVTWPDAHGIRVQLDGADWPARLPPFTDAPSAGTPVTVEGVANGVLIVRPVVRRREG